MDIPKLFGIILKSSLVLISKWTYAKTIQFKKGLNMEFNLKRVLCLPIIRMLLATCMLASMCHVKGDWDLFAPFSVSKATLPRNSPISFAI